MGGSTGLPSFRPGMEGFEAKDIMVEDCYLLGSSAPIAFVGVDGATVRHNTMYLPTRWIIRILQESQGAEFVPCRNGQFFKNVVVYRSDQVRAITNIGGGTEPDSFRFAENVWFCLDRPEFSWRVAEGLPTIETAGVYGIDPMFRDAERGDLRLQPDSPVRNAGVRAE